MTWTWQQARAAAGRLCATALFPDVLATARPRGVVGIVRARGPLPLLLFVTARDGLIVEQDNGGFAVLQRPFGSTAAAGGYRQRFLRWLNYRWDFALYAGPALILLATAAAMAPVRPLLVAAAIAGVASLAWICAFMLGMFLYQVRWLAGIGARTTPDGGRAATSLPAYHWSVVLVHQPDPAQIDELISLLNRRLISLVGSDLQRSASGKVRVDRPNITETLVVLKRGVSTHAAREAIEDSVRANPSHPSDQGVILLESPSRLEQVPKRPIIGGGFLVLYLAGLACAVGVGAAIVASAEARACLPASCASRPATYASALQWLLQRLLFSDPPHVSPALVGDFVLGWLVSVASAVGILVAITAARWEIRLNRQTAEDHAAILRDVVDRTRILFLVVTPTERDAVLACVREYVRKDAVLDADGERVVYALGRIGGKELMLVQAPEQGPHAAAGMLTTAQIAVAQCRPDIVILTGICYGLRPDEGQELGDVVVARRVQNIDHKKVTERDGRTDVRYRGVNVGCSANLLSRFQTAGGWSQARVHIGTVLSSGMLVDSRGLVQQLRDDFPEAIAGEMEASAVHEAVTQATKPDWIVVKGISDWGFDKTDRAQARAAGNAASFAVHVIASVHLPPRTK